jgi:hypothetical protein
MIDQPKDQEVPVAAPDDTFVIAVGRMQKIESLHKMVARRLLDYSDIYRTGKRPKIRIR